MNPPRRIQYPGNPRLQWLHPPVDPRHLSRTAAERTLGYEPAQGMVGLEPDLWATELSFVLDRICASGVGRAVVLSVSRATTIYHCESGASTDPDTINGEDGRGGVMPQEAHVRASTTGFPR
jgi:hypothetical protein